MKINLKKEITELKDLLQTIVDLQNGDNSRLKEAFNYSGHSGLAEIQTLKALHKAEILDIQLSYPTAAAKDIVETDLRLAQDLHTYLGYFLQDKDMELAEKEVA